MVKFKKKSYDFLSYCPLEILTLQFCKCNISKSIKAKDVKPVLADKE